MNLKEEVTNYLRNKQQLVAAKLGAKVNTLPVRNLKIGLIVFGLTAGTCCVLLVMGIVGTEGSQHAFEVDSISMPKDIHRLSMDSLRSFPSKVIDSLEAIIKKFYTDQLNY